MLKRYKLGYEYSVVEAFETQVKLTPNNIALADNLIQYDYKSLNAHVNRLAYKLKQKGISLGDFVGVLLKPSSEYIIFILAVIKAGGVYVPLDVLSPSNRLQDIITDANLKAVITDDEYVLQLKQIQPSIYLVKQLNLESISNSIKNLQVKIKPDSPLYMIYTSGSTGRPKGVIIPHQAVVNLAKVENYAQVKSGETIAQFNNVAFDASTFEIWSGLLNGAKLEIIPFDLRNNYLELKEFLHKVSIRYLLITTAYLHQIIKSDKKTLDNIDVILFGGEQVNPELLKEFILYRKAVNRAVTLINGYGPSEATTFACKHVINSNQIDDKDYLSAIGKGFANARTYILDTNLNQVAAGELYLSGIHLALGYHNSPEQNKEKFLPNPFCKEKPFTRLYKTGDLVKTLSTGELVFTGRVDDQVKVGGYRIHLEEIERQLMQHEMISLAAVTVEIGGGLHKMLVAYIVFSSPDKILHGDEIRSFLAENLPVYMLPAKYVMVDNLPLTSIGKIDKRRLDSIQHTDLFFHIDSSSNNAIEEKIKSIWKKLLNRTSIASNKNLFELGANSLLITEACSLINKELQTELQLADLLSNPTIHQLKSFIVGDTFIEQTVPKPKISSCDIAIVGMSCRFPQANNLDEFWNNLCLGKDCLERFVVDGDASMIGARGILEDIELFDASFFGINPADAKIMDPQQRVFLECSWQALEHANIASNKTAQIISVFAGMTDSSYLHENLLNNAWFNSQYDNFQQRIATSIGMLSTQISYRLNLKGKSLNVNTACSTGLSVVGQACQELLTGQSDIALAGAVSIVVPQDKGYRYQEGSILSSDGYCRPFSSNANGTVFSNGVGVLVLKRVDDAIADNDTIYAIIKGCGLNNDGADKLGLTAPSVNGQKACIKSALQQAKLTADSIGFVEAHGTATALGDVIEIKSLTAVYQEQTSLKQFCAIGSVKANIGHTDVVAGIAGIIKTALCLHYQKIPPLIHFDSPNKELSLDTGPFFVNKKLLDWDTQKKRYAAVSSFGVGGTNAHLILSEYNSEGICLTKKQQIQEELILLSAKSKEALEAKILQLQNYFSSSSIKHNLSDIAYTLQTCREDFNWRTFVTAKDINTIIDDLMISKHVFVCPEDNHSIVFMLGGQGTQYNKMCMNLLKNSPVFASYVKQGFTIANKYLDCYLEDIINDDKKHNLTQTQYSQPVIFIIEYALAKTLIACGIQPDILIGHSLGEYVCACLAQVFSFEDAVAIVCERALLMSSVSKGAMLAIECSNNECLEYQSLFNVEIALHNAEDSYVLAGTIDDINNLKQFLATENKRFHQLAVSHAFHSRLMQPIEKAFKEIFNNIKLSQPCMPIISNVTGDWLLPNEALDPNYWYAHLRNTVEFNSGIKKLLDDKKSIFIEVGLGNGLSNFVKKISNNQVITIQTLPSKQQNVTDIKQILNALGELWLEGIKIIPEHLYKKRKMQKIALPVYPFQRQRYWIDGDSGRKTQELRARLYSCSWQRCNLRISLPENLSEYSWVIFKDLYNLSSQFVNLLLKNNINPIVIDVGKDFIKENPYKFKINPNIPTHFDLLFEQINSYIKNPIILHALSCNNLNESILNLDNIDRQLNNSFYSLMYLTQAYIKKIGSEKSMRCAILTYGTQSVLGYEDINPFNKTQLAMCKVVPLEHDLFSYKLFDIDPKSPKNIIDKYFIDLMFACMQEKWDTNQSVVAYRNEYKWSNSYSLAIDNARTTRLFDNDVFLVTGGFGDISLSICEEIVARVSNPIIILCSRTKPIPKNEWHKILRDNSHKYFDKIKKLDNLRSSGALISWYQIDISDYAAVESLLEKIKTQYGKIGGLIHTAGVPGGGVVQLKTKEIAQKVFFPKIHGTLNLAKALQKLPSLEFVVFMSSIASISGELGQIDYCAANAFLDACAETKYMFNANLILSINWNTWSDAGMSVNTDRPEELNIFARGNNLTSKDANKLFTQALSLSYNNLIVSNYNIGDYINKISSLQKKSYNENITVSRKDLNINSDYIHPKTKIEEKLVYLWQNQLHIDYLGVNDSFFSLGGNSLNALSLIEKINNLFNSTLSLKDLYDNDTIIALSKLILSRKYNDQIEIILPLKISNDSGKKIFCCHPISGMLSCFDFIVQYWKSPSSVYGLQDPSIFNGKLVYDSLLDLAKIYVAEIRKIQPTGPYSLIGYSFGGSVVYEIANILRNENNAIDMLVLIDSWSIFNPNYYNKQDFIKQIYAMNMQISKNIADLSWQRIKLLMEHKPSIMSQNMILFQAKDLDDYYKTITEPLNGWSKFNSGNIICKSIDANHHTIINKENSKIITDYLQKFIK